MSLILGLGLERFCPQKGCPWPWQRIFLCSWPWPRALCARLHLWCIMSYTVLYKFALFCSFRNLHFIIANFLKNCDFFLQDYEDHVNSDVGCAETLVNFHASDQNRALTSYLAAAKKIANYYFTQFVSAIIASLFNCSC